MIRVRLPMVRPVGVDDDVLVLDDHLRIDAANGAIPQGSGHGVVVRVQTWSDAGVPVAEGGDVAGDDYRLAVGRVDELFE